MRLPDHRSAGTRHATTTPLTMTHARTKRVTMPPRAYLARPADCALEPARRPEPPVLRPQSRPADDFTACPDFGLLEDVEASVFDSVFDSVFVVLPTVVDAPGFIVSADAVDSIASVVSAGSAIISMSSDDAGHDA